MEVNRDPAAEKAEEAGGNGIIADSDKIEEAGNVDETHITRRILLKMDTRILPVVSLLFLCSFLDRTNVGNAKIIGLEADLQITNLQYNQGLAVFYATYIASELPSNLVLKKVTPKIWLPALTIVWGIITMSLGFVRNFGSFFAVRALLGIAEGGLLPGIVLYLSGLYTRQEMALRIGIFYTAASLSGAFGGLLARGLSAIGPRGGLEGWRWIFIIEGLITVAAGLIAYLLLPTNIVTASFLADEEKTFASLRLQGRTLSSPPIRFNPVLEREERFKWSEVYRGVFNIQVWFTATAYFAILSGLYSFGLFLPTIINDLHITSNPNQSQLWSVIPYAVATPVTVFIAFLSDRLKLRGVMMLFTLPIAIIGYAVIANVTSANTRFAMTNLMAIGMYGSVPCVLVWNSNNSAGHYKRATTSALQLAIANCGGFVATFVYPTSDGPLYHKGHTIILGLLVYGWFAILANVLWCMKINRDKKNGKYAVFEGSGDDRDPSFKMIL
ncbi:major facilitator superfamily domain-containing protein [Lasiosphaeria miniovina]|uniref:Major facilitator superfamily domain-containing protein n=1 Tax=Lasiosphaeria miniovina TaxID=1954250 RepID=A0AA40DR74_9PEZI|nr:major facilitator superfamily domain-containing protein [Lasiosphaeria miniovina]KAK0713164.1 major facilitator superfamily domain-containing protein [Lasiosphaeria miniovina]